MIFIMKPDGTIARSIPSPVYQGADGANTIYLFAPAMAGSEATVAFKTPDGTWTEREIMTSVAQLPEEFSKYNYCVWSYTVMVPITRLDGTVTVQFFFYANGRVCASSASSFVIGKGVPAILPEAPSKDVYDQILQEISEIRKSLQYGDYASRAIFAWRKERVDGGSVIYGKGEFCYIPFGKTGSFVRSIVDGNTQPPYVDGKLNGAYWEEIVNFDYLDERYFSSLKDIEEKAETAKGEAVKAQQNAETAKEETLKAKEETKAAKEETLKAQENTESAKKEAIEARDAAIKAKEDAEAVKESAVDEINREAEAALQDIGVAARNASDNLDESLLAAKAEIAAAGATVTKTAEEAVKEATAQAGAASASAAAALNAANSAEEWAAVAREFASYGIKPNADYSSFEDLPRPGDSHFIYYVPNGGAAGNAYDEYIWIEKSGGYEKVGSTEIDLSSFLTKELAKELYLEKTAAAQTYATKLAVETAQGAAEAAQKTAEGAQGAAEAAQKTAEGKYTLPAGGMPKTQLAEDVQEILGRADSALWDDITGKPTWIGSQKPSYSYSEITGLTDLIGQYIPYSHVGVNGGIASLGNDGKVPTTQLPFNILDIYPVGSIYLQWYYGSNRSPQYNPNVLFGGSWEMIKGGYYLETVQDVISTEHDSYDSETDTDSPDFRFAFAGLPNITGEWQRGSDSENTNTGSVSGAFINAGSSGSHKAIGNSNTNYSGYTKLGFNAGSYNSIYGKSDTVRPRTVRIYVWRRTA